MESEPIDRKSVMTSLLEISDRLSKGEPDSETLVRWHSYLENLAYKIKSVISQPTDKADNQHLEPFQLGRIGDFLEDIDKQDFPGAIYEIHTILNVEKPKKQINREELILVYLLLKMALNLFQTQELYFIKPRSSNSPIVSK